MPYSLVRVALISLPLLACSSSSGQPPERIEPLSGTGLVRIEMNGGWRVDAVDTVETYVQPGVAIAAEPFLPPAVGDLVRIDRDLFESAGGRELLASACVRQGSEPRSYLNHVDGRLALYDLNCGLFPTLTAADGGSTRLQLALGSTGADQMMGLVQANVGTAFPQPGQLLFGLYRVSLVRVP